MAVKLVHLRRYLTAGNDDQVCAEQGGKRRLMLGDHAPRLSQLGRVAEDRFR